jgi:HK97 family phage major capsid protein
MSAGQLVVSDENYKGFAARGAANSSFQDVDIDGSLFVNNGASWRDARATIDSTTGASGGAGVWIPLGQPSQTPPVYRQMRLFLRDVLSVQSTGLASVPYIREVNPAATEFSASAVAEGAAKPEVAMNWVQDDAPVRKIAAWVPATEEAIDDAPTLRGYIDTRLSYMLAVREEFEILNGSGAAPHLKGILQFADLQTITGSDKFATLGLAQAKIELVDGDPDGIAMNPTDYWTAVTTRQSTRFDGEGFTQGGNVPPFGDVGNMPIWGLPVVRSRALPTGTAIVANWRMGATLFDRLQTTIRVGNQHSDFFTNNKVAILAEERVALAVHRPDFFVKVTFS